MKKGKVEVPSLCETIVEQFVFEKSSIEELRMLERQLSKKITSDINEWSDNLTRTVRRNWPEVEALTILETYLSFYTPNDSSLYFKFRDGAFGVSIFIGENRWRHFVACTFSTMSKKLQKLDKVGQMMLNVLTFYLENHFLKSMRELVDK